MESFLQNVLVRCFQPRLLNHKQIALRTTIQYLIEVVSAIELTPFSLVTFGFLSNTLNSNFDRYLCFNLQNVFIEQTQMTRLSTKTPEALISRLDSLLKEDKHDVRATLKTIFPEGRTTSRFSVANPYARFSIAPDTMRETINALKKVGKQEIKDVIAVAASRVSICNFDFSRSKEACEDIIADTINKKHGLNENITDLFKKAAMLESADDTNPDEYEQYQIEC